ncbi:MAG: quinolinate synthase NadA [Deltaproteobacteria bacterium]|nr:quinolinate synthase NadA [Deltaproteobacteria bacterium]
MSAAVTPPHVAVSLPLLKDEPWFVEQRRQLGERLATVDPRLDLEREITKLKHERNAVILAHYYQDGEIQDLADHLGDSLQLAQAAKATKADVIVFCGVHFMAETAKILNPDRIVVVPDMDAGCSLADGCKASDLAAWKARHPEHAVISYINCSADVKALSDVIVTSSNAEKIVRSFPADRPILFAPDRNLGEYLVKKTGRKMDLWQGACVVHEQFDERRIVQLKERYAADGPVEIIAHPECEGHLLRHADFVGSTSALLSHAKASKAKTLIVATEPGILHLMKKARPDVNFVDAPGEDESCKCNLCPHMKRNTLEKLYLCLRDLKPRLEMDAGLMEAARKPIERMLSIS